ncbi:MAG: hypothetical protein FGM15_00255 [Chthoniobacterales bacterium]|nr:hypothetical protein [Chthoniobacterales bacterium]
MNREQYLRELDSAGRELLAKGRLLAEAANPINQLRGEVARDWKWWLPGASVAGFAAARLLRMPRGKTAKGTGAQPQSGAAFWVPTLLKLLPAVLAQLVPLFLSLRSGHKR